MTRTTPTCLSLHLVTCKYGPFSNSQESYKAALFRLSEHSLFGVQMAVNIAEPGKKMMVAIDESETSYFALIWVLDNLQEFISKSSHPLVLFMVLPPARSGNVFAASLGSARMFFNASPNPSNAVQERDRLVSSGILERAKSICNSYGVNAETVTVTRDAKEAICDAVQKFDINLLVLGDHGAGEIKRAILGSVSNYCALNAKCSVLIVKKPERG